MRRMKSGAVSLKGRIKSGAVSESVTRLLHTFYPIESENSRAHFTCSRQADKNYGGHFMFIFWFSPVLQRLD